MTKLLIVVLLILSARRGSVVDIRFWFWPLLGAGLVIQVASVSLDSAAFVLLAHLIGLATLVALGRAAGASRLAVGAAVVGGAANLVPMATRGSMPVSAQAVEFLGRQHDRLSPLADQRHVIVDIDGRAIVDEPVLILGDIIPVPVIDSVISLGDIILALGLIGLVVAASTNSPRSRQPRGGPTTTINRFDHESKPSGDGIEQERTPSPDVEPDDVPVGLLEHQ